MDIEIIAVGGYEEVGRNMTAVRCGKEIVIFDDYYGTLFDIPDYQVPAIWVLFNLFDLNSKSLFNKLRNSQHVALTIEVNRMGIAIFNRNFKKQDFNILRWFFF